MPLSQVYDFHTHTVLSDGDLTAVELIRRCIVNGYGGLVITDHAGVGTLERVITEVGRDCALARQYWGFEAYAGVELTHVPASAVGELAARARACGAALVVVHGESPVEPVEPGTNLAAVSCPQVDILAHPGLLTPEEAAAAREMGVYVELTARQGHGMANGHVAQVGLAAGVRLLVNSDAHAPKDILTPAWAAHVVRCAGLPEELLEQVLGENARAVLQRARTRVGGRT